MQGDLLGIPPIAFAPGRSSSSGSVLVPSIRGFKISENESPRPQDRFYFGFNYYDDINKSVNERLGANIAHERVYRETFALEKTFLDGDGSIGFRVPLNTLSADSTTPGLGGSSTDVGDLVIILKYAPWHNADTGNLFSMGLLIGTPTGPSDFAGSRLGASIHSTALQPFVGYIWNLEDWFVHGFTALDVPTDSRDVTMLYNDIGLGYYLYRERGRDCKRWISAVAPTVELHVNTPLNHRGAFNFSDTAPTPDGVDVTTGMTIEINRRATWAIGFVTPLAGPRPFDYEVLTQLNWRF
jgi:hypothetical protein